MLGCCFSGMIKARASGSKVYLYFYEKGQAGETPHSAEFLFKIKLKKIKSFEIWSCVLNSINSIKTSLIIINHVP